MENWVFLVQGALITLVVSLVGCAIGVPLGLAIALARIKRIWGLSPILSVYVSFIRSMPLILFVLLFYFGIPIFGINLNAYVAGVLALALNNSAYTSEIWRSAIANFPQEQIEAAKAFGMTSNQSFRRIVMPQIWRASLPVLTSEVTLIFKASPAIGIIGINDLTRRASKLAASNFQPIAMMLIATLLYIVILLLLTRFSRSLDRHFQSKYELL